MSGEVMEKGNVDKSLFEMPMAARAEEALKKAVAKAITEHKLTGDPIVVWRDGRVVKIPADQIEIQDPAVQYKILDKNKK
jgi:hypothetical protein